MGQAKKSGTGMVMSVIGFILGLIAVALIVALFIVYEPLRNLIGV